MVNSLKLLNFRETEKIIYTCSRDGTVRRLNIISDDKMKEDKGFRLTHDNCVMDMSLDGDRLATACSGATVTLWNIETQEKMRILRGHQNGIRSVYLKEDYVVSGSRDKTVKLWNVLTGETLRTFQHSLDVR